METRKLEDVLKSPGRTVRDIRDGKIFAYPTDTVYGLGCNVLIEEAVRRIRSLKNTKKPFTVIVPSREWIESNLTLRFHEHMDRLPGPYTLIFRKKRKSLLRAASSGGSLGVRMPFHPFTSLVQEAGVPFITTSANISGTPPFTRLSEMPKRIREGVDIAIDGGVLGREPSVVIDLTGESPRVLRGREPGR